MAMLRFCLAITVTLLAADALTAQTGPPIAKPRADRLGDPLPAGALYRVGTTRLQLSQSQIDAIAISPDGKRVAAVNYEALTVWEMPGGREVLRIPRESASYVLAFTSDGKSLLCQSSVDQLCLFDVDTGKIRRNLGDAPGLLALACAGPTATAVLYGEKCVTVRQWDVSTAKKLNESYVHGLPAPGFLGFHVPYFALSPDGKLLAVLQQEPATKKVILCQHDTATGAKLRGLPWPQQPTCGFVFSSDGRLLAAALDRSTLVVLDVPSGKELGRHTLDDEPFLWFSEKMFAFAPGNTAVLTGNGEELMQWDWRTGKLLRRYPARDGPLAAFPDGKRVAVGVGRGAISVFDTTNGKDVCPLRRAGAHAAFTPDGRRLAYVENGALVLADAVAGIEQRRWHADAEMDTPIAFSADGKKLAIRDSEGISVWSFAHDRRLRSAADLWADWLVFAPVGDRLALGSTHGDVAVWDSTSGKRLHLGRAAGQSVLAPGFRTVAVHDEVAHRTRIVDLATGKATHELAGVRNVVRYIYSGPEGADSCSHQFAMTFSPDGRLLLAGSPGGDDATTDNLVLWDVNRGKRRPLVLPGNEVIPEHLSFSPDGRLLAAMRSNCHMALLSTTTGAVVRSLGQGTDKMSAPPGFTPDGRIVITAVHGLVQLWEVATGGEIARREGHKADVRELVMSPDGRTFATISDDGTILVWDLTHLANGAPPAGAEALWSDLASADAVRGRRAIEGLIAAPAVALPMLRERLRPTAAPDEKQIARWIADLDSDDFDRRQQAERGLDRLAELAGPALRQALTANPSLEAQRRMEGLLKKLDTDTLTADALRGVRAVQVLESIGDDAARRQLRQLAAGAAGARMTTEATAALARLERRPK